MEDDREKNPNSGETIPETTSSSSEFEFGSLTPSSPSHSENSPADHLFLNGRLLPHTFPTARSVSRTTSENTDRSNSTSSRSSDSSSPTSYTPRTITCFKITNSSTGDGEETNLTCFGSRSEKIRSVRSGTYLMSNEYRQNHRKPSSILDLRRKPLTNNGNTVSNSTTHKIPYIPTQCKRKKATEIVTAQLYGSYSRGWQHITPVFKREGSVRSNGGGIKVGGRKKKTARKKKKAEERRSSKLLKWWRRILKVVVLACRECHAMEPQRVVNDDADGKNKIIKCP